MTAVAQKVAVAMNLQESPRVNKIAEAAQLDILVIIGIITSLIKMWKDCGLSEKAIQKRLKKPSIIWKSTLRRKIREAVPKEKVEQTFRAFLDNSIDIEVEEVGGLLAL